jgi:two-component system sensor histidine kinase ChiS
MPVTHSAETLDLRTAALEAQLLDAKRELAELRSRDALKTQFLSNISHDLRTPLSAIITHGEILREGMLGPLSAKQHESVNGIISGGRQLLEMVSEILTYARGAADRLGLNPTTFALRDVVHEVIAVNEAVIGKRSLTCRIDLADALPPLYADREKITHVLNNLVGNAIDFTKPGGSLWIAAHVGEDNGQSSYVIEVGDTGVGIAAEHFELIFQEFAQVDSSASRPHHGTGLGLAIARRLVELHGGRIWLTSVLGEGTRFYFSIPVTTDHAPSPHHRG